MNTEVMGPLYELLTARLKPNFVLQLEILKPNERHKIQLVFSTRHHHISFYN